MVNKYTEFKPSKEIESHSSAITNDRIGEIKMSIIRAGLIAMTEKPSPFSVLPYFASNLMLWEETHMLYNDSKNEEVKREIDKCLSLGVPLFYKMSGGVGISNQDVCSLLRISMSLQYLMNTGLQNVGYFFKGSVKTPKGIKEHLEIFNREDNEDEQEEDGDFE